MEILDRLLLQSSLENIKQALYYICTLYVTLWMEVDTLTILLSPLFVFGTCALLNVIVNLGL